MKRQALHVKDNAIYDQFTKQQVIWTHGYGATDRYVTRNEWGALLLQWPVHIREMLFNVFQQSVITTDHVLLSLKTSYKYSGALSLL